MINSELKNLPCSVNKVILSLDANYTQMGDLLVTPGDRVYKNQALTKVLPDNDYSVALHSPIDGLVTRIDYFPTLQSLGDLNKITKVLGIEIESDSSIDTLEKNHNPDLSSDEQFTSMLANYGIIGLGGAGFPTHKKLQTPNIETIIINAMECESPINVDNSLIAEYSNNIIDGLNILNKLVNPKKIIIAIKQDYTESIELLKNSLQNYQKNNISNNIFINVLDGGYPNGYSKTLIKMITKQELSAKKHSSEHGIICLNIATVFSIEQAINHQQPVINRIVTINGTLVNKPGNYLVPIGTPLGLILQAFNIDKWQQNLSIRIGGDYMGYILYNAQNTIHMANVDFLDSISIEKTTQAISINHINQQSKTKAYSACIKCGFCEQVCPMNLLPQQLFWYGQKITQDNNHDILDKYYISSCIECSLCDSVCPSNIPLTAVFKNLKTEIKYNKHIKTKAESAKVHFEHATKRQQEKITQADKLAKKINTQSLLQSALNLAKNKKKNKDN